jgi:hypothetical protein
VAADLRLVAAVSEGATIFIFRAKYFKEGFVIIHPNTQIPWNGTLFRVPAAYWDVEF